MSFRVATNLSSINARRNIANNQRKVDNTYQQLSSGSRINKAADDAAGLAISERMKAQIRSNVQATRNANDGISMIQTAEGGLGEISNIITRLRELAIQSASDTVGETERTFIDKEVQALKSEAQRIAKATKWGSTNLLDGSTPQYDFQVGIFDDPETGVITFDSSQNVATIDALGIDGLDFTAKDSSKAGVTSLDNAQTMVNGMRANLGALQNRLVSTVNNLRVAHENISAANSRVRDTEIASASAEMARNNILLQSGVATLSQANAQAGMALNLLG